MTGRLLTKPTFFREATRGDEAVLTPIAQRTIATCYHRFFGIHKVIDVLEYGALDEYVLENLGRNYCPILLLDGLPVGFAVCVDITIDLIVIDYHYHRLGLGTQLLAHCEAEMFQAYPELRSRDVSSLSGNWFTMLRA
jgi:ribosomal protein S18 acetylase RimI-like enzyme